MPQARPVALLLISFLPLLSTPVTAEDKEVVVKLGGEEPATSESEGPPAGDPFGRPRPQERGPCAGLGVKCFVVAELHLIGIVAAKDPKDTYAILQGPDNKGYNLRVGDEVADGKLVSIEKDRATFDEKSKDPLDPKPVRPAVKMLDPSAKASVATVESGTPTAEGKPKDPFSEPRAKVRGPCNGLGVKCFVVAELDLIGIVIAKDEKDTYAILQGPDDKGYNLRVGDELQDGKVTAIEKNRVTFDVRSGDPLDSKPFHEQVKRLEPTGN